MALVGEASTHSVLDELRRSGERLIRSLDELMTAQVRLGLKSSPDDELADLRQRMVRAEERAEALSKELVVLGGALLVGRR